MSTQEQRQVRLQKGEQTLVEEPGTIQADPQQSDQEERWNHNPTINESINDILATNKDHRQKNKTSQRREFSTRTLNEYSSLAEETQTPNTQQDTEQSTNTQQDTEQSTHTEQSDHLQPICNYAQTPVETSTTEKENSHHTPKKDGKAVVGEEIVVEDCPECSGEIDYERQQQYCSECGLVITETCIDPGPEWRAFNSQQENDRSRVGSPMNKTIHDKGLSTVIGNGTKDAYGNPLSQKQQKKFSRLRKWDNRFKVKNTQERNLRQAFGEIDRLSSELNLPDYVEETACTIYRRAHEEDLLPGRSIESMASATVYISMRKVGIPKTLDTLITYCQVSQPEVTGAYRYICRELNIEVKPPKVLEYVTRICSNLNVSSRTQQKAEDILQEGVESNVHSGKDPSGLAASAVYAATLLTRCDRVTQKEASEVADVCELTIRERERELLDEYGVDHEELDPPSDEEIMLDSQPRANTEKRKTPKQTPATTQ